MTSDTYQRLDVTKIPVYLEDQSESSTVVKPQRCVCGLRTRPERRIPNKQTLALPLPPYRHHCLPSSTRHSPVRLRYSVAPAVAH